MHSKFKILVDTHIHTISSGHAYSTVLENVRAASAKGIEMIAITDHGPIMKGASSSLHFANLRVLPLVIEGVRVLKGIEANIIDYNGTLDIDNKYLMRLDFVLASLHDICITPSNVEQNTSALVNALKNPYVDAIAHPGNPVFPVDIEQVVLAARDYNKFIEINNHSFKVRTGSENNCREFVRLCKLHGVRVVCGSDAHFSEDVGKFDQVERIFQEIEMPKELIMNVNVENFEEYLKTRRK